MGPTPPRARLTIREVMLLVVVLALVLRGLREVPTIVQRSTHRNVRAALLRASAEALARNDAASAAQLRASAEEQARLAARYRPDPVGYFCYAATLAGAVVIILTLAVLQVGRWVRGPARRGPVG